MMNKFYIIFRLIKVIIRINQFNNVHSVYHRYSKKLVNKITSPFNLENVPQIPANAKLKMQWYMAECICACENFNRLIDQRSTSEQRRTYLLSGALGALCDMIIDDIEMDVERIQLLKRPPLKFEYKDEVEKLYVTCYHTFLNSLEEDIKERTIQYYELLFDAQLRSKQQFDPNITLKEVDEICKEKSGYSMLFLRAIVNGKINSLEKEAWFELGAFIQYCNDAQDLYKDLQKKLRTFASVRSDLETIANDIDKQKILAFALIKKTSFQKEKKDSFLLTLYVMHIGILSKLHAFSRICNFNFSFEKFLSKSKKEIQSKITPISLFSYVFPRVINYQYESVEAPIQFKHNLRNKSTTKNKAH